MKKQMSIIIPLTLIILLFITILSPVIYADANGEQDILFRIDNALDWISDYEIVTEQGSYYLLTGETIVDITDNSVIAYLFAMHTKLVSTDEDISNIRELLQFLLSAYADTNSFHPHYDTETSQWIPAHLGLHYSNAEILQNLAFVAFHLHLQDHLLTQADEEIVDECIEKVKNVVDAHQSIQTGDGGWTFSFDDRENAELKENSEILAALLYVAAYEKNWGDAAEADHYTFLAQKTALWILDNQETVSTQWGYGGFYQTKSKSIQTYKDNAIAVYGLTSYLRLITFLTDNPNPTIQMVRESIVLWEQDYLKAVTDGYGGPSYFRENSHLQFYPKTTANNALCLRAMVEVWVVHGDPKYREWTSTLYEWITGNNEANHDFQDEQGYFIYGFKTTQNIDNNISLKTQAYVTLSLIYAKWINIPELTHYIIFPLIIIILFLVYHPRTRFPRPVQIGK